MVRRYLQSGRERSLWAVILKSDLPTRGLCLTKFRTHPENIISIYFRYLAFNCSKEFLWMPCVHIFVCFADVTQVVGLYSSFTVRDRRATLTHHNFRITCSAFWAMNRPRPLCGQGVGYPNVFVCLFVCLFVIGIPEWIPWTFCSSLQPLAWKLESSDMTRRLDSVAGALEHAPFRVPDHLMGTAQE
jgi:hypothetical protein